MQRRLNLACGLLGSPPVLLLDEPTVGVDPQSLDRIAETLRAAAAAGGARLYSTHHMDEAAELCDRVVLIDNGRVIASGTPAELETAVRPGVSVDVVTSKSLPPGWLDTLSGARAIPIADEPEAAERGSTTCVAIDDLELASRVLELAQAHARVLELHVRRSRLHEVFIALTGRAPRD